MSGEQTNINMPPAHDPLIEYRVTKVEDAVAILSAGFADIAATIRGAKWAVVIVFGFIQPVLIYYLTVRG